MITGRMTGRCAATMAIQFSTTDHQANKDHVIVPAERLSFKTPSGACSSKSTATYAASTLGLYILQPMNIGLAVVSDLKTEVGLGELPKQDHKLHTISSGMLVEL